MELSIRPTMVFVRTPPAAVSEATVQVTAGVGAGIRPYTSVEKAAKISGRRRLHQVAASVTRVPSLSTSGSGIG